MHYLVNVAVLTTGFDAPYVDVIAILRPTEYVSLYQQIIGRGLRLPPGKTDCLILDYAGNPNNLYMPEVGSHKPHSGSQPVQVLCPQCRFANLFLGKTPRRKVISSNTMIAAARAIKKTTMVFARSAITIRFKVCRNVVPKKTLPRVVATNAITLMVDPDDMLKAALKLKDALVLRYSGMQMIAGQDEKGESLKITYIDEDGADVSERFRLHTPAQLRVFTQQFLLIHQRAPGLVLT
ncbi:MAG: hypothetical protein ACR5LF_06320 [Symbiopectobacterium sp.]